MPALSFDSPVGILTLLEDSEELTRLSWGGTAQEATPLLLEARRQLLSYFAGELRHFDLPLRVDGSSLQRAVCDAMRAIPFGETRTYGEIAKELGSPAQAIGRACGGNPLPIVIPCHRVLSATGLGGFSGEGGVETKVWLLQHEGAGGFLL